VINRETGLDFPRPYSLSKSGVGKNLSWTGGKGRAPDLISGRGEVCFKEATTLSTHQIPKTLLGLRGKGRAFCLFRERTSAVTSLILKGRWTVFSKAAAGGDQVSLLRGKEEVRSPSGKVPREGITIEGKAGLGSNFFSGREKRKLQPQRTTQAAFDFGGSGDHSPEGKGGRERGGENSCGR